MNVLAIAAVLLADIVNFPMPPEKVDPSTVAVTNEHPSGWWPHPYHERYRVMVDFDFDGHDDMFLSEPMANFGTGGGCWTVYHWTNGLYQAIGDIGAHYAAWSFEKNPDGGGLRLWHYWHSSCCSGWLGYYQISEKGVRDRKEQNLFIVMDPDGKDVASQLYSTALKEHGIRYRYETSVTRNGMVAWRTAKRVVW